MELAKGKYVYLENDVRHLSKNSQHVLINTRNGQWVKMTAEAYQVVQWCRQMPANKCIKLAVTKFDASEAEIIALFDLLLEKNILATSRNHLGQDMQAPSPTTAAFCVTTRCNLECITCCRNVGRVLGRESIDLHDVKVVLEKLSMGGCSHLKVTGGEPLLREDISEILSYARELFQRVCLETNGTLIDASIAKKLNGLVDSVNIGLDGSVPEIHDAIRGQGSFAKTIRGIQLLQEAGIHSIVLAQTLTRINADDMVNIDLLARSLGVKSFRCVFFPTGRGRQARDRLAIIDKRGMQWPKNFPVRFEDEGAWQDYVQEQQSIKCEDLLVHGGLRCGAVTRGIYVSDEATVYPCEHLEEPKLAMGNLLGDRSLEEILVEGVQTQSKLLRNVDDIPECKDCDVRYFCGGGCMALRYYYGESLDAPDPLCEQHKSTISKALWGL